MEENKERDYVWLVVEQTMWNTEDCSEEVRGFRCFAKAKEFWAERVAAAEADWKERFGEENYGPGGSGKEVLFVKNEQRSVYESWLDGSYLEFHIMICIDKLFID